MILLLAYTGLRWAEASALRVGRVNLAKRRIRVSVTFYEAKGGLREGLPKTGKRRTIAIPPSLVTELEPLVKVVVTPSCCSRRSVVTRCGLTTEFNAAIAEAGLAVEGLTPHRLRHTAASLAIAAGADVKVVQQMLGHKDAAMTLNIYGHLFPDRLDEVATRLDAGRMQALEGSDRDAA